MIVGIHKYGERLGHFLSLHCASRDKGDVGPPNFRDTDMHKSNHIFNIFLDTN